MGGLRLAWKNIWGNGFRSLAVLVSAAVVAAMALSATFVIKGAEAGLRNNLKRLGADILVLPWGTMTQRMSGIRLMSAAINRWMPRSYMYKLAALDGVEAVSPQLYLAALEDSPYSPYPTLYLVAFDPATDFTLKPWVEDLDVSTLGIGEALAGAHVTFVPEGETINLYGVEVTIVGRMMETETSIDDTLFVNFETADAMISSSTRYGGPPLDVMSGTISAILVRLELGENAHDISLDILQKVPGLVPLEAPNLFQAEREQMIGVLRTLMVTLVVTWGLLMAFMGLIFTISINERSYEIGVLRALGFTSKWVFGSLIQESVLLAVAGGLAGLVVTSTAVTLIGERVSTLTQLPVQVPSVIELVLYGLLTLALVLISVALAAFIPSWRISREEPALAMRA